MTALSDPDLLMAAIFAEPEDDNPRLQYADCLDERGDADRAEFIRVQCRLARWSCNFKQTKEQPGWFHDCGTDDGGYWLCQPVRSRERELFAFSGRQTVKIGDGTATIATWWEGLPGSWRSTGDDMRIETAEGWSYVVRRGFVAEVKCDLTTFLRIAAGLAALPVTRVVLTDREPSDYTPAGDWYGWWCSEEPGPPDNLPEELWDRLPGATQAGLWKMHESEDAATASLALAAANHVRSLAPTTHRAPCPTCEGTRRQRLVTYDPASDTDRPSGTRACRDCDDGWVTRPGLPPLAAG